MIITSSVFFVLFGSWRSYNSLSHAGIYYEKKKSKSKKKLLAKILHLNQILHNQSKQSFNTLLAKDDDHKQIPIIINTWPFHIPCDHAWNVLKSTDNCVSAVVAGCTKCEQLQCDGTVGHGGSPDEDGETTLDAMIMDGATHDAGCVAGLKRVKSAISVANAIMQHTSHTLLVGESATQFALSTGFKEEPLQSNESIKKWTDWLKNNCQPNFRRNVSPDSNTKCGPYKPLINTLHTNTKKYNKNISNKSHDTIGMIAIDSKGNISAGTSTNGAQHKIPGRVGDSPLVGSGAYVDNEIGAACSTGDGDTLMKFMPSYQTVESIRNGMSPTEASKDALKRIAKHYPNFKGAVVAIDKEGTHGAACHGFPIFHYCYKNSNLDEVKIKKVICTV